MDYNAFIIFSNRLGIRQILLIRRFLLLSGVANLTGCRFSIHKVKTNRFKFRFKYVPYTDILIQIKDIMKKYGKNTHHDKSC